MHKLPGAMGANGQPISIELSYRQYTVLRALAFDGATNAEIGKRLFLTEDTVKSHLRRLFRKLEVQDRLGLCVTVWSGATDVWMADNGEKRHLLAELRQLQSTLVIQEKED